MRNAQLFAYVITAQGRAKPPGFWLGLGAGVGLGLSIGQWVRLLWG